MENTVQGVGLSGKYSIRQSQMLYLTKDPTQSIAFVNNTLTDLVYYLAWGGLSVYSSNDEFESLTNN